MGFWADLFASDAPSSESEGPLVDIKGDGKYSLDAVGESYYQSELNAIAGGKTEDSHRIDTKAILVLDDDNPHDDKAVGVTIDAKLVGYLSREHARQYRKKIAETGYPDAYGKCGARIVGGWRRDSDEGHYGVKLDIPME